MERPSEEQRELPFGEAEGSFAERKELLGLALLKLKADLHLAQLCLWIFNATDGGIRGTLRKSYDELAANPWGLCCGKTKARATVDTALRIGLVESVQTFVAGGGYGANEYRIDWAGVRESLTLTSVATRHRYVATRHRYAVPRHSIKEHTFPALISETETETGGPWPRVEKPIDASWEEVPELAEAADRTITPLPAGQLRYGAFAAMQHASGLSNGSLVVWFRQQLSLTQPLTGQCESDLLLVLAAGLGAAAVPQAEVQKNRIAIFASTVSKRLWWKVFRHVPAARKLLDAVLAMHPSALTDEAGLGPRMGELLGKDQ